jgi:Spy/CpxP family protein refolding chaperone
MNAVSPPAHIGTFQNPKTTSIVALTLVFLVGALVGAVAMNMGIHRVMHPPWTPAGKEATIQRYTKELDLTQAQSEQLRVILDDFSRYYQDVMLTGKGSIYRILNDEQKQKFEKMLDAKR